MLSKTLDQIKTMMKKMMIIRFLQMIDFKMKKSWGMVNGVLSNIAFPLIMKKRMKQSMRQELHKSTLTMKMLTIITKVTKRMSMET